MYRLTITEREQKIREEVGCRRIARIQQVRQQARQAACRTRQRVRAEAGRQLVQLKQQLAAEWNEQKENRLSQYEAEYGACLRQVGAAHLSAARQPDLSTERVLLARQNQQVADVRHQAALRRIRMEQRENEAEKQRTETMRQLNRALERVRSERIAQEGQRRRLQELELQRQLAEQQATTPTQSSSSNPTVVYQSAFRRRVSFRDEVAQTRPRPRCKARGLQTEGQRRAQPTTARSSQTAALGRNKKTDTMLPEPEPPASAAVSGTGSSTRSLSTAETSGPGSAHGSDSAGGGTSSFSDVPHSETAVTRSELLREISSSSRSGGGVTARPAAVPLTSETRPAPDNYQVLREQAEYDARAAAQLEEQRRRELASREQLAQKERQQAAAERGRQALRKLNARGEYGRLLAELEQLEAEQRWERRQGASGSRQLARATACLAQSPQAQVASYEQRQRQLGQLFEDALLLAAEAEQSDDSVQYVTPAHDLASEFDRHGRHIAELLELARAGQPLPDTEDRLDQLAEDRLQADLQRRRDASIVDGVQAIHQRRSEVARASLAGPPADWPAADSQSAYPSLSGADRTSLWRTDQAVSGQLVTERDSGHRPVTVELGPQSTREEEIYPQKEYSPEETCPKEGYQLEGSYPREKYPPDETYPEEEYLPEGTYPEDYPTGMEEDIGYGRYPTDAAHDQYQEERSELGGDGTADSGPVPEETPRTLTEDSGEVPSLRTTDLSSPLTADLSEPTSEVSSGGAPAGQTFDSGVTTYQRPPGDQGGPADAARQYWRTESQLRQYVNQLLDMNRQQVAELSGLLGQESLTDYQSVSGQSLASSLSCSGPAGISLSRSTESSLRTVAESSRFSSLSAPIDSDTLDDSVSAAAEGTTPEKSGATSGVFSEPTGSAAAAAAAPDAYLQRYTELMEKLSEVQQRRDDLMRSFSSVAEDLRGLSQNSRPRPPPVLRRTASDIQQQPHELSTILEADSTSRTGQPTSGTRLGDATSTGSLSRTGLRSTQQSSSGAAPAAAQDDMLSQLSVLTGDSQEFQSPQPAADSSAALQQSRESLRAPSSADAPDAAASQLAQLSVGSDRDQSSPDVGRIISRLGLRSRSCQPAGDLSSSSSTSESRLGSRSRASGDDLRRRVLSRQAVSSSTSSSSSASVRESSPGSLVTSGSASGASFGLPTPMDLATMSGPAPPPSAADSSVDTDKFEAGVLAGGVQSTPLKAPPEAGPVSRLKPPDLSLPSSDSDEG